MVDAPVTIRTATSADAARLNELHISSVRALCSGHYTQEILEGWLLNRTPSGYLGPISRGSIFVAELGDEIVGFGEAARGVVVAVYVDPGAAGRGIGRRILQHALAVARSREDRHAQSCRSAYRCNEIRCRLTTRSTGPCPAASCGAAGAAG